MYEAHDGLNKRHVVAMARFAPCIRRVDPWRLNQAKTRAPQKPAITGACPCTRGARLLSHVAWHLAVGRHRLITAFKRIDACELVARHNSISSVHILSATDGSGCPCLDRAGGRLPPGHRAAGAAPPGRGRGQVRTRAPLPPAAGAIRVITGCGALSQEVSRPAPRGDRRCVGAGRPGPPPGPGQPPLRHALRPGNGPGRAPSSLAMS
jgi:hypothetical protein